MTLLFVSQRRREIYRPLREVWSNYSLQLHCQIKDHLSCYSNLLMNLVYSNLNIFIDYVFNFKLFLCFLDKLLLFNVILSFSQTF